MIHFRTLFITGILILIFLLVIEIYLTLQLPHDVVSAIGDKYDVLINGN